MDIKKIQNLLPTLLQRYKYVIIILLIGIVLMFIPGTQKNKKSEETAPQMMKEENNIQQELESILELIQGAGNVKVMLKESIGEETVYQINEDMSSSDASSNRSVDTIILTDSDRNEIGLIKQINPAQYLGAVIICQGADNPSVKLSITNAVSKITGLGADKIVVLKMK